MSLNVGVLGHVDSGKTTLTKALADTASTASFDRHADRGGRYNTVDLGFSSLMVSARKLTLVDCPGHAGLIKAVLAASNVFDMALVVVDASCGIQPQTAEHLLLCSIFCPSNVIIVLNKIDLVPENQINTIVKKLRKTLKSVGISENSQVYMNIWKSKTNERIC
uniref:Tr-type G domain-containing protein n=1 Tax=Heterorhabditis bacteriophora TaxID=37862 RepID=A0A1I7XNK7_HETBA